MWKGKQQAYKHQAINDKQHIFGKTDQKETMPNIKLRWMGDKNWIQLKNMFKNTSHVNDVNNEI